MFKKTFNYIRSGRKLVVYVKQFGYGKLEEHGQAGRNARLRMPKFAIENNIFIKESMKFEAIKLKDIDPNKFQ